MNIAAGVDIETTGLLEPEHRIVEVYVGHYDLREGIKHDGKVWRIHPQRSITAAAQSVHHIAITDLEGCPVWTDVATEIRDWLEAADIHVAHNGEEFDLPFINAELERIKLPRLTKKPLIDTMLECRWATPTGAVPNLAALCWACGIEYDPAKAHAASYDVDVMMGSFFRGVEWGWIELEDVFRAGK
jgi:DNA polymerase-3 subunit epsilon